MSKDNTFYFPHDYNTRMDRKIKKLLINHGYAGYGIFWAIVEDLYNNANALRTDYDGIAYDLRTDSDTVKKIINDYELFEVRDDFFSSPSVERRLNRRNEKSVKATESAHKRWDKTKPDANALRPGCEGNAIKERKGKERKDILAAPKHTKDEIDSFKKFQEWVKVNAERVSGMKEPFSIEQYLKVKKAFHIDTITDLLKRMHNWQPLTSKNRSAYLTFMNWSKEPPKVNGAVVTNEKDPLTHLVKIS